MVERNLAKVEVASSSLVSRSNRFRLVFTGRFIALAGWQSGYAADCKSVYAGSIPTPASLVPRLHSRGKIRFLHADVVELVDTADLSIS